MGRSRYIQEREATDSKFRACMDTLRKNGKEIQLQLVSQLKQQADGYYRGNKFNHNAYLANEYEELQNSSAWSLENVDKVIGTVATVLLGQNKDSKDVRVADPSAVRKIGGSAAALVVNQQLVVSRVFDAVASILGRCEVFSETGRVTFQENFPIFAGLHMFLGISSQTFQPKPFVDTECINQVIICYEVRFSDEEAALFGSIDSAAQYGEQIRVLDQRLIQLGGQRAGLKSGDELARLENFIATYRRRRDAAQQQLDSLHLPPELSQARS